MGFFEKIKKGLAKTKTALGGTLDSVLTTCLTNSKKLLLWRISV